ncbi:major strawberry allergen Fra a 1-2-like [Syzygium oleosum]|uniref:major strawberry allergen Fra a 1-2-like n=1 Tax=Syzygium oleosum TaxID=219896 RepID=UPI0024B9442D|nr:major strawberry allergen Fra a 1-2-like [Syzygium oleosum]
MGVFTFINEYISTVPPARLFKALILDSRNLVPKLMPQAIKSIDIIQGDGGAGTIRQINFIEGNYAVVGFIGIKSRVDELNKETFTYRYSIIDLDEKFESIVHEVKFEPTLDGESKNKVKDMYYTKGDVELKEEDVKARKGIVLGAFKATEAYLLKNPNAYA